MITKSLLKIVDNNGPTGTEYEFDVSIRIPVDVINDTEKLKAFLAGLHDHKSFKYVRSLYQNG